MSTTHEKGEQTMENDTQLRISAEPVDRALPTVGPWFITCSEHGALGMATTALAADRAVFSHSQTPHVTAGVQS